MIRLSIPLRILGWQRVSTNHRQRFNNPSMKANQRDIRAHVRRQVSDLCIKDPVAVALEIGIEPPREWSRHRRQAAYRGQIMPTVVPDLDNMLKQVCDSLNGVLWDDDRRIVTSFARKFYHDFDHATLTVAHPAEMALLLAEYSKPIYSEETAGE